MSSRIQEHYRQPATMPYPGTSDLLPSLAKFTELVGLVCGGGGGAWINQWMVDLNQYFYHCCYECIQYIQCKYHMFHDTILLWRYSEFH